MSVPILIQDFNPGGASIGADFVATLHRQHGNVRYVKLEEPLLVDKVVAIRERLGDAAGVLEGWGGYYMLEGIPAGICGVMPGVATADLLNAVFRARVAGQGERAYRLFAAALPLVAFGLQNMELFLTWRSGCWSGVGSCDGDGALPHPERQPAHGRPHRLPVGPDHAGPS